MNHPSQKLGFGRMVVILGLLGGPGIAAHAQTKDVTPPSAAQSLKCLVRQEKLPVYPHQHELNRTEGFMRVQLHFSKADAPPRIEVLVSTAAPEMQERTFRYLEGYRLPCLSASEGTVKAVQEFSFKNTDREPLPVEADRKQEFCIVMPREPIEVPQSFLGSRHVEHVVAVASFSGDGQQAPEVTLIHSTASRSVETMVRERLAQYRMPCRSGAEPPQSMHQQFSFSPAGERRYVLKREVFGLAEFLGLTAGVRQLQAEFDFATMGCPFKVDYTIYGSSLPNEVRSDKKDPNRISFLKWLSERQIAFANDKQANELFGQTVQIQVPCGSLNLKPVAAAG